MKRLTKRIPKRVREQAALICAIAACELPEFPNWGVRGARAYYKQTIGPAIVASDEAIALALEAWRLVTLRGRHWTQAEDAEAEALLRCGWSPDHE